MERLVDGCGLLVFVLNCFVTQGLRPTYPVLNKLCPANSQTRKNLKSRNPPLSPSILNSGNFSNSKHKIVSFS